MNTKLPLGLGVDRNSLTVVSLDQADDEKHFWMRQTPEVRMRHLMLLMNYNIAFLICVLFQGLMLAQCADAQTQRKPNVLFIVVDDLRCGLGCYGDPEVKSPNIDRFSARAMKFDRAYCQYPVCNPSRSSFLTGLRPDTHGIFENQMPLRRKFPDIVTLPQAFREQGYFTSSLGKIMHAGLDASGKHAFYQDAKSWDDCRNFDVTPTGKKGENRNFSNGKFTWSKWLAAEGTDEDQPDGQIAAEAIKLLEAERKEPFFLAVGFHKPHDPYHAPKKYFDQYPLDQIQLARDPNDRSEDLPDAISRDRKHDYDDFTDNDRREFRRAYYACTSFTDAQIGKLFDTLDRRKLWDDTIVIMIADHGYHLGEHGWWLKFTVFELCARIPMIVWVPDAKGMGSSTKGIVELVDVCSTLTDLCEIEPPAGQEGVSFRNLLDDPAKPGKPAAYTQTTRGEIMGRSVRTDRWRYTEWGDGSKGIELYDHNNDSLEYYNLAAKHEFQSVISEMKALLHSK